MTELATMRARYDAELAAIRAKVVEGHGHEAYPVLFDRTVAWEEKAPLLKPVRPRRAERGDSPAKKTRGRKKAAR